MLQAVLFDLDGTLLPLPQEAFIQEYLHHLAAWVSSTTEPRFFINQLLAATEAMIRSKDAEKTNREVFFENFIPGVGLSAEILHPLFEEFYQQHFHKVKHLTSCNAFSRQAVMTAQKLGLKTVVATNPLFPIEAIRQRMEWANIHDLPFDLVTSYETSHYCKPHGEYYQEIAKIIGCPPEECLMIGNDIEEDLAAAKIGMKTYLVTDCLLNGKNLPFTSDYAGSMEELAASLEAIVRKPLD